MYQIFTYLGGGGGVSGCGCLGVPHACMNAHAHTHMHVKHDKRMPPWGQPFAISIMYSIIHVCMHVCMCMHIGI